MPFRKGASGNPGGMTKKDVVRLGHVRELARVHTDDAIDTLATLMLARDAPPAARVNAAQYLLNRAWGMPESSATIKVERSNVRDLSRAEILELLAAQGATSSQRGADEHGAVH